VTGKKQGCHKAAYRFFSNERVHEGHILEGHFQNMRSLADALTKLREA